MLPSDHPLAAAPEISDFGFAASALEVTSVSSDAEMKVVQLAGQMNGTAFWRAQAVISELEETLQKRLNNSAVLESSVRIESGGQKVSRRNMLGRMVLGEKPAVSVRHVGYCVCEGECWRRCV